MIYIFGSEKCDHCTTQKNIIAKNFKPEDWQYIDVLKDDGAFDIAVSVDVIGFPTIIATNNKNEILLRHTGVISADKIFESLYPKTIPIEANNKNKYISGRLSKIMLASYPDLVQHESVDVRCYDGELIGKAKVKSISKEVLAGNKKFSTAQKQNYLNNGGRQDYVFVVDFERIL